jgi:transposase-like protein
MEELLAVRRRQFRSRSEILDLLQEYRESKLSVKLFCEKRSISEGSFQNWRKRYGTDQSSATGTAFTAVSVSAAAVGLFAEVNGIRIYQPVSAGYLKELLP